jgi:release factor glutamine methyltransferase
MPSEAINSKFLLNRITNTIKQVYDIEEAKEMAFLALEHFLNLSKTDIILDKTIELTESQSLLIENIIERLLKNEPIQYIIGETWFLGRNFNVDNSVLIPRPETEEIVHTIIQQHKNSKDLVIADFCTGSACIAISLEKELNTNKVYAYEISESALQIANKNAVKHNSDVVFIQQDILKDFTMPLFDIIVSNPPYVCESEKVEMRKNVLDFEPHLALFVPDNDALLFYKRIIEIAKSNLKPNGSIYFEINQGLGDSVSELLRRNNFTDIRLITDFRNNQRMVCGIKGQ